MIFHDDEDNMKFLDVIQKYKMKSAMNVYAWCLMSNHVHLLLKEGEEDLSITMKRIGVSFAFYYNWKYRTSGHLFQDRFKSENVENVSYFLTVVRYIHQNPLKAGIVNQVDEWRWSSCKGYYDQFYYPGMLLDNERIFTLFSEDRNIAKEKFKEFNERSNRDDCLDEGTNNRNRLTDVEASLEIQMVLGEIEIAQVKSLPKLERKEVLKKIKKIERVPKRQVARILGISANQIFKV